MPHGYQRRGFILVALLVALVVVLGWRAASLIAPENPHGTAMAGETASGKQFIVYGTSEVTDRRDPATSDDDVVAYEFLRFPLDGAGVNERLLRVVHDDAATTAGAPLMRRVTDDTLLLDRRDGTADERSWMDASGVAASVPVDDPDAFWGLPSPDGSTLAYVDRDRKAVTLVTLADGLTKSYATDTLLDLGYLSPLAWTPDSSVLYLTPVFEGEAYVPGLWKLDLATDTLSEVSIVRELGLNEITLDAAADTLVGATFECESVESCGTGPSALYVVDLASETAKKLLENPFGPYRDPHVSPDGSQVAYTRVSGAAEIRVVPIADPTGDRRVISGNALDWTPDGTHLVVDRDSALQLVDVESGTVTTVARRQGNYLDPDYKGLDYIGIIRKR